MSTLCGGGGGGWVGFLKKGGGFFFKFNLKRKFKIFLKNI